MIVLFPRTLGGILQLGSYSYKRKFPRETLPNIQRWSSQNNQITCASPIVYHRSMEQVSKCQVCCIFFLIRVGLDVNGWLDESLEERQEDIIFVLSNR